MTPGVPDTTAPIPPLDATGPRGGAALVRRAPAPETTRLYAIDRQAFGAWCQAAGLYGSAGVELLRARMLPIRPTEQHAD